MHRILNYIDGRFAEPAGGAFLDNVEPATGAVYSQVADSDERDIARAIESAERAFPAWSLMPAEQRSRLMLRIAELIEANLLDLARAESIDTGKPVALARALDIPRAAANFRFFATSILHASADAHLTDDRFVNLTLRQPRGVAGAISPWNLPLFLLTWKIAPAIATGNTVVAKPSELTPMTASLLCDLCGEAGLPPGVINIVHGTGAKAGAALVAHPRVPAVTFTGGTKTGREIARVAGPMFKKISLELGGKNPNIVFADADMEDAIATSVRAAFSNQGQICLCGSRIFVERSAYDRFVEQFVTRARRLRVGDPLDDATEFERALPRGILRRADGRNRSSSDMPHEHRGDLRSGRDHRTFRRRSAGDRVRQLHRLRVVRQPVDARRGQGLPGRQGAGERDRMGELLDGARLAHTVRRHARQRRRTRRRRRGAPLLH
jgi:aminomuconate-semialdehyde/2-hydroxymuconate-6-semialdehyde dehydrogenase